MKILDFFLFLWVIFAILDQETQINSDPCGCGSETLAVYSTNRNFGKQFLKLTGVLLPENLRTCFEPSV